MSVHCISSLPSYVGENKEYIYLNCVKNLWQINRCILSICVKKDFIIISKNIYMSYSFIENIQI